MEKKSKNKTRRVPDDRIIVSFIVPMQEDKSEDLGFMVEGNGKFIALLSAENDRTLVGRRYYFEIPVIELRKLLRVGKVGKEENLDSYINYVNGIK